MKSLRMLLITVFIIMLFFGTALAQIDLASVLPVYPDAKVTTISREAGARVVVDTQDDSKAVMIFYRKMLAYDGWQVSSGSVLNNDPIIVFIRNGHQLTMESAAGGVSTSQIIFSITE